MNTQSNREYKVSRVTHELNNATTAELILIFNKLDQRVIDELKFLAFIRGGVSQ